MTYSPLELFDILGPSARTCFSDYTKSGQGLELDFHSTLEPGQLVLDGQILLRFIISSNIPANLQFHQFFFGELSEELSNPVEGANFTYKVPTF